MNAKGYNFNSRHGSAPSITFNKSKKGRFGSTENPSKKGPGPGQYSPRMDMSKTGTYFYSKWAGSGTRTFYHSNRQTIKLPTCANLTPGPGSYRIPSEFGQYESRQAHTA